jgi:flagellar hook-basal body complex protein FliE
MDLHDVVLAAEMESLAFNLAVEIRNRLVDAYGEISRMQI